MVAATAQKTAAYFVVRNGPAAGQRVDVIPKLTKTLPFPVFVIGRDARCHLTLEDPEVSNVHAFIMLDDDGSYQIKDNDTRTGTTVDGEAILDRETLYPGCTVRLGGTVLRFDTIENKLADILREVGTSQAASADAPVTAIPAPSKAVVAPSRKSSSQKKSGGLAQVVMLVAFALLAGALVYTVLTDERLADPEPAPNDYVPVDYTSPGQPGQATVLYFSADWCTYCPDQKPVIQRLDNNLDNNISFREIDIDTRENYALVRRYNVNSVPRIIVLDGWNHVQQHFYGLTGYSTLYGAIQDSLVW